MTTSSTNYTGLYSGGTTTPIPNTAYGNANVVSLLAAGTDGGNTVGNIVAAGNITSAGNVAADYFIGDGSALTNINAGNIVGAYGNANVAAFLPTYTGNLSAGNIAVTNKISAVGNVVTDSFFVGNFVGNVTGNITVPGLNTQVLYNNSGNVGASAQFTFNATTNALSVLGTTSVSGNITGANIIATGNVNATTGFSTPGNVFANNISTSATGGNIFASANICAIGNINTPQAVNAVTISATGNVVADSVNATNTVRGGIVLAVGPGAYVSAVGNVVAGTYFIGDGSLISNITAANVNGNVTQSLNTLSVRIPVKNTTASTLAKGTPVYATGAVGATNVLEVAASRADTAGTMAAIGILETALTANAQGYAISVGELSNIDTSTYTVGQELYVGATGGITGARPTGANVVQTVGVVGRVNASTGHLTVNIWNQNSLPNLGSGNVWVGNATGYPTQTTYGAFTGNLSIGNLLATDVVYANTYKPYSGNAIVIDAVGNDTLSLSKANIYSDYLNVGNIYATNPNPFISGTKASSGMRLYSGNATSPGPGINMQQISNSIDISTVSGGNITLGTGTGVVNLSTNILSMTGTVISAATANITANVYFGNGSQLTGVVSTPTPAGSNTQLQYNNAGTLAGVSTLTFDNITGNIAINTGSSANVNLGNMVFLGNIIQNSVAANAAAPQQPNRIIIGNGYNGSYGAAFDPLSQFRGGTFHIINKSNIANTDTNQTNRQFTSINMLDMGGGTLSSATRRMQGGTFATYLGNGTFTATNNQWVSVSGGGGSLAVGTVGNIALGNATVSHGVGAIQSFIAGGGGSVGNAIGVVSQINVLSATGNVTNAIGYAMQFTGSPTTQPTNVLGLYNPNTSSTFGATNSTSFRSAPNYYFLYNEDAVAQVRLGTLRSYNEFKFLHGTTSGALTINKQDAQVQQVDLAGAITSIAFSNFVSALSDGSNTDEESDTVTVIFNQGVTGGYSVAFPSGSTYKYAGGVNALSTTAAGSVTMMTVSAVRLDGANTTYLITISPGFV